MKERVQRQLVMLRRVDDSQIITYTVRLAPVLFCFVLLGWFTGHLPPAWASCVKARDELRAENPAAREGMVSPNQEPGLDTGEVPGPPQV